MAVSSVCFSGALATYAAVRVLRRAVAAAVPACWNTARDTGRPSDGTAMSSECANTADWDNAATAGEMSSM